MKYGVANRVGRPGPDEIRRILTIAQKQGINTFDTAIAYGDSESLLGKWARPGWRIITKLGSVPEACGEVEEWALRQIIGSLKRLNVGSLYGILLHNPSQVSGRQGREILAALEAAKRNGLTQKIGVSIYEPAELDKLQGQFLPDIVQTPFNILDRRILTSGWLHRMKANGTEVHVRSVFLQGLLLMSKEDRPVFFQKWDSLWDSWHAWLKSSALSPIEACLCFAQSFPEIDRIVVGVESCRQLMEILKKSRGNIPDLSPPPFSDDNELLDPSKWRAH